MPSLEESDVLTLKTLLALSDEQKKAAIGVLTRKKINKDRQDAGQPPLTQEQVDSNP